MRFDMTDLRLFVNVHQAGSMTGGAALCNLTLQSASERIRGMESELGVPLLIRSRKGVVPSEAGHAFLNHARIVLAQVEHMQSELREYGQGVRGHIQLLCNSSAQTEHLPAALGPYLMARPGMSVSVREMLSVDIVAAIKNRTANIGIVANSTGLNGLAWRPYRDDELVALVPAGSPWSGRDTIAFEELAAAEFVGLSEGNALQDHIDAHARELGRRLHYRVRMSSLGAVIQIVDSGAGIAIMPRQAAERAVHRGRARIATLADAWAGRKLIICARDFSALPGYATEFLDFIVAHPFAAASAHAHIGAESSHAAKEATPEHGFGNALT